MVPSLIALAGPMNGEIVPLSDGGLTLGRDAANSLQISDLSLSRNHCAFRVHDDQVTVADLESTNGTFVNGVPVKTRVLEHGDQLKIGESTFLFMQRDALAPVLTSASDTPADPTVQLRRVDVLYLQSDQMIEAFPPALREVRTLEGLLGFGRAIASATSADAVDRAIFDAVFELVPAEHAAILMSGDGEPELANAHSRTRPGCAPLPVSRTIVARVLAEGVALLSNDAVRDQRLRDAPSIVTGATGSLLCAPIGRSDRVEGVLYLAGGPTARFESDHLQLATAIAGLAALAYGGVRYIERLQRDLAELRTSLDVDRSLIGESAAMRDVYAIIGKAARSDATVLIVGESGTGKELAARDIHRNSPRAGQSFVAINASELAESLLESELFGHERGAFTGAIAQKKGKLEVADGGTIFLDEIGDLTPAVQVKLLRVLQQREFTRVGGTRPIKFDVRIVAATNKNLEAAVKSGAFRQDLFYRLNVVTVRMPPLRERPDDISLLATLFARRYAAKCKRPIHGVTPEARACLMRYNWPGNVRELENAIERAVVLGCSDRIAPEDLPESVLEAVGQASEAPTSYHECVQAAKKRIVLEALERASGHQAEAARQLGIHPNNLNRLIRQLGLRDTTSR